MALHVALAVAALVASAALFMSSTGRTLALVALAASAVEVAMAFGLVRLAIAGVPLGVVLALLLAVPGLLAWLRASAKIAVTASALVAFVGVVQVLVLVGARL